MHNQPELTVWYGEMPESNGKSNWTAILCRKNAESTLSAMTSGITIARSEYPGRVKYEADCMRYLIGELTEEPDILEYDTDTKSAYAKAQEIEPQEQTDHGAELAQLIQKSVLNHIGQFRISPKLLQPVEEMTADSAEASADSHNFDICQYFDHWLLSRGTYITRHTEEVDGPLAPALNWIASVEAMLAQGNEAKLQPTDPLDWKLPCDLTAGGVTIGKGCSLRTVQHRLQVQHDANVLLMKGQDRADVADTELLNWLESEVLTSYTGISIDKPTLRKGVPHGFRFLRHHYSGTMKPTLREAIEHARTDLSEKRGGV